MRLRSPAAAGNQCRSRRGFTLVELPAASRAFTLVELLIVVGIIVILISILVPVIASVRKRGYETSTSQEMSRIGTACQAYYTDFHAYPGPIPESQLDLGPGTPTNPSPFITVSRPPPALPVQIPMKGINGANPNAFPVTSSQNLTLGLIGGATVTIDTTVTPPQITAFNFDPSQIVNNSGPQNLNALNPRQYNAYLTLTPDELPTMVVAGVNVPTSWLTMQTPPISSYVVPEILDRFPINSAPYHMPILYVRARPGAAGIVVVPTGGAASAYGPPATYGPVTPAQYSFAQLWMYQSLNGPTPFTSVNPADYGLPVPNPPIGAPVDQTSGTPTAYTPEVVYFANPGLITQPRGKDSFILISAGTDNIYGTKDDIIYSQ